MLSSELETSYPKLSSDGGKETSPKDSKYNCIAWAAAWDKTRWWQPDKCEPSMHWPDGVLDDGSLLCFIRLFESLGYDDNKDNSSGFEMFYEKVVIYEDIFGQFTHVARQKYSGIWWSKLGEDQDVYHNTPEGLESQHYGKPTRIMKRPCGPIGILLRAFFKIARLF